LEFLRGVNLHDLVAKFGPQPESRVVHIVTQICDSLAEAHALGLVHRDVKPGNVFLCRRGGISDCVKVLDFGLVRDYRVNGDANGRDLEPSAEGTPWFMPPEAIQGAASTDPRSDIYSLGALGYFLLTGSFIFDATTVAEIHQKQLTAEPIPPTRRTSHPISPEMERIILQCLEKDMNRRPKSVTELRALLMKTPDANDWTVEKRTAWWDGYELQAAAAVGELADQASPMPTMSIDLASRME